MLLTCIVTPEITAPQKPNAAFFLSHVSLFLRFDLMCSCSAEYLKARNNGASQAKEKEVKSHSGETD